MFLKILILWVINISLFAFLSLRPLNATVVDVYPSSLSEPFADWRYKPEVALENVH